MESRIHIRQQGMVLLEGLIAILIISLGILSMMKLQATAIVMSGDAKYRSDASLLANQLIGQMWVGDRTPPTPLTNNLQTSFQGGVGGTDGASYTAWATSVAATLPGVVGVPLNQPTVTVTTVNPPAGASSASSLVTIRIFWKSPTEAASTGTLCGVLPANHAAAHCYIAMVQIV